jgi:serine/threonine protein phosphatase PrpC
MSGKACPTNSSLSRPDEKLKLVGHPMNTEERTPQWQVIGQSVRGAAHQRTGMPNQDAICWLPESGIGLPLVLAIADGHGSARYSRSHTGAKLAVEISAQLIHNFLAGQTDFNNLSLIKRAAEEWLPQALVRAWVDAVTEHISENPLPGVERGVRANNRDDGIAGGTENLTIAYGATIIAVAVAPGFIIHLQLGDGEILTVDDQAQVSRPLAKDERLFANETTSLCAPDAWRDFRVGFQPITNERPALILLATDGYPNSFRDESGFLKVGSDILTAIRAEGVDKVKDNLETWLTDSTNAGSGDDVTLGIICSPESAGGEPKNKTTGMPRSGRKSAEP